MMKQLIVFMIQAEAGQGCLRGRYREVGCTINAATYGAAYSVVSEIHLDAGATASSPELACGPGYEALDGGAPKLTCNDGLITVTNACEQMCTKDEAWSDNTVDKAYAQGESVECFEGYYAPGETCQGGQLTGQCRLPAYEAALRSFYVVAGQGTSTDHTDWETCAQACFEDAACQVWAWADGCTLYDETDQTVEIAEYDDWLSNSWLGFHRAVEPTHICPMQIPDPDVQFSADLVAPPAPGVLPHDCVQSCVDNEDCQFPQVAYVNNGWFCILRQNKTIGGATNDNQYSTVKMQDCLEIAAIQDL